MEASTKELLAVMPAEAVRSPALPMATFIHEGLCLATKAREEEADLRRAGLPEGFLDRLEQALAKLQTAQVAHETQRRYRRSAQLDAALRRGRAVRDDALAACTLALRRSPGERWRLESITRKGDAPADVVAALANLAVVVDVSRHALESVGVAPQVLCEELAACKVELEQASTTDAAARALSLAKERRDRLYTLVADLVADLRAFARYAFRRDVGGRRRAAFGSEYYRARRRMQKERAADQSAEATLDPGA